METSLQETIVEAVDAGIAGERAGRRLISGVDWQIRRGEFWVLGGAHGSGKTALLNTIAGLLQPATGIIRHFGKVLASLNEAEHLELRTRIGFVFRGGGRMFNDMTVAENVALPLCYHRNWSENEAAAEVAATLQPVGLGEVAEESTDALAFGWQRRVGLARALVMRPEVIFLDEPLAGLDARQRQWWGEFLHGLSLGRSPARQPMAVVCATNDFSLWSSQSHFYGVIREGRWQAVGKATEPPELH